MLVGGTLVKTARVHWCGNLCSTKEPLNPLWKLPASMSQGKELNNLSNVMLESHLLSLRVEKVGWWVHQGGGFIFLRNTWNLRCLNLMWRTRSIAGLQFKLQCPTLWTRSGIRVDWQKMHRFLTSSLPKSVRDLFMRAKDPISCRRIGMPCKLVRALQFVRDHRASVVSEYPWSYRWRAGPYSLYAWAPCQGNLCCCWFLGP